MKSKITIEVDFENRNEPVIQILSRNSDDVRDNLIQSFLQSLSHTSRWCRIEYAGTRGIWGDDSTPLSEDAARKWVIKTVKIGELEEESRLMAAAIEHQQEVRKISNRRFNKQTMQPAELAILNAQYELEKVGADKRLIDAATFLDRAKNLVGDYIDEISK